MQPSSIRTATWGLAAAALALLLAGAAPPAKPLPKAPDFTLTLLDGSTLRLADLNGKPVVINFWQSG